VWRRLRCPPEHMGSDQVRDLEVLGQTRAAEGTADRELTRTSRVSARRADAAAMNAPNPGPCWHWLPVPVHATSTSQWQRLCRVSSWSAACLQRKTRMKLVMAGVSAKVASAYSRKSPRRVFEGEGVREMRRREETERTRERRDMEPRMEVIMRRLDAEVYMVNPMK
jgi:hypothetical protein